MKRSLAAHSTRRQRTVGGPLHLGVKVDLIPLVESTRGPRPKRNAEHGRETQYRMDRHWRRKQPAQAGKHDQTHHARLCKREQVAPMGRKALVMLQGKAAHVGPIGGRRRRGKRRQPNDLDALKIRLAEALDALIHSRRVEHVEVEVNRLADPVGERRMIGQVVVGQRMN